MPVLMNCMDVRDWWSTLRDHNKRLAEQAEREWKRE